MVDLEERVEGQAKDNSTPAIHRSHLPRKLREASIRAAVDYYGTDLEKVANSVGLNPSTTYQYARKIGISFPPQKPKPVDRKQKRYDAILAEIEAGNTDLGAVATAVGLKPSTVRSYAREIGVSLFKHKRGSHSLLSHRKPVLEELVERRASSVAIGDAFSVSRQRGRQLLLDAGLHSRWKQRRKERREIDAKTAARETVERTAAHTALLSLAMHLRRAKAREAGWADEMAVRYFESMMYEHRAAQEYGTILELFQRYEAAQRTGNVLSLEELGKPLDLHPVRVGEILRRTGVEPLHGKRTRHCIPKWKKEAALRAAALDLSAADVGYFLDVPSYIINQFWHAKSKRTARGKFWNVTPAAKLTYRLASQIYQVDDWRYADGTPENLASLLGTTPPVVHHALAYRAEIAPPILHALRVLYPEKQISAPYLP